MMKHSMKTVGLMALLVLLGFASAALSWADSNLVAHWDFEKITGSSAADVAGKHDATLAFNPKLITKVKRLDAGNKQALHFDGLLAHAIVKNSPELNPGDQITVAAWIQTTSKPGSAVRIVDKQHDKGYALALKTGTANLSFYINGKVAHSAEKATGSNWRHVVGTYDGSAIKVYIDGELAGQTPCQGKIESNDKPLTIGANKSNSSGDSFEGSIDDVRIYSRALEAHEIKSLAAGKEPDGLAVEKPAKPDDNPMPMPMPMPGKPGPTTPPVKPSLAPDPLKDPLSGEKLPDYYILVRDHYLNCEWEALEIALKDLPQHLKDLSAWQREDLSWVQKTYPDYRPKWWKSTKSPSNVSFQFQLWGKTLTANYVPSSELGLQAPVDVDPRTNKLRVIVTWRPHFIDSTLHATGKLAEINKILLADVGEVIVWHELGHNFITTGFPANQVMDAYQNHLMLFKCVQEFFADMSALSHTSPKARRTALMFRLEELENNDLAEAHTRGAYGIGSLLLATILMNPEKWPNCHLPPAVPEGDVERLTIMYLYEHFDKNWSIGEDRAIKELAINFVKKNGDAVFKKKGEIQLPNGLKFNMMAAQDNELKGPRDQWVAEKLKAAIAAGRADKKDNAEYEEVNVFRGGRFIKKRSSLMRIDVPWDR